MISFFSYALSRVAEGGVVDVADAVVVVVEAVDVAEAQVDGPGLVVPVAGDVPLVGRRAGRSDGAGTVLRSGDGR